MIQPVIFLQKSGQRRGVTRRQLMAVLTVGGSACMGNFSAMAETAKDKASVSAVSSSSHSSLRLMAAQASTEKPGHYDAAIALRLNPGFKTYWRHPGDSGVPPVFDFSASDNLASAIVSYPAPQAFPDGAGGHSFGYRGPEALFPVTVTAVDPAKPVLLKLRSDYAVCETICILANGTTELMLQTGLDAHHTQIVMAAQAAVPVRQQLGQGKGTKIVALRKSPSAEHFIVDVELPADTSPQLFIEGETPWFFETKTVTHSSPTKAEIVVAVIERSKAADCTGAEIILTLVADKLAIEVATRLDLALVTH